MNMFFLKSKQQDIFRSWKKNFWVTLILLSFLQSPDTLNGVENQVSAIDANDSLVAVWQEDTVLGTEVKASALPFGSPSWEAPVTLSTTYSASLPKLAVAANGPDTVSVAIWVEVIGGIAHLYGAMRPSLAGAWTSGVLVSNGIEDLVGTYELHLNPTGNIIATWTSLESGTTHVRGAHTFINIGNSWGLPVTIN